MYTYEKIVSLGDSELRKICKSRDSAMPLIDAIISLQESYAKNPQAPPGQMLVSDKPKFAAISEKMNKIKKYAKEEGWG